MTTIANQSLARHNPIMAGDNFTSGWSLVDLEDQTLVYRAWNMSDNLTAPPGQQENNIKWSLISLIGLILLTAIGNLLVCLAVCWERRLQNMTNYFLMSLAIADFLVAILVMPLGMIVEIYGIFPLNPNLCVMWVTSDVLMCTASIWHMCTMSMDRYFTLKYPMRYGRNKTKKMVLLKIFFVWAVSIAVSSPVCIHGFIDTTIVYSHGQCVPTLKTFVIYGSVFAFYIPLVIMIVTYILTIRILLKNQRMMKQIERSDFRSRFDNMKVFPNVNIPKLLTPPSGESSAVSYNETTCINDSMVASSVNLGKSSSKLCENSETENDSQENLHQSSAKLLKRNSHSYKSLQGREDEIMMYSNSNSQQSLYSPSSHNNYGYTSLQRESKKQKCKKKYLQVPSEVFFQRSRSITSAKSDSNVSGACHSARENRCSNKMSLHLSFNHLDHDSKSAEWNRRFVQIQQEMDQCLQDSEREKRNQDHRKKDLMLVDDFLKYSMRPLCRSAPSSPLKGGSNSDNDQDEKSTSSTESDLLTIRFHSKVPGHTESANGELKKVTSGENGIRNYNTNNEQSNEEVNGTTVVNHPTCEEEQDETIGSDNEQRPLKRSSSKFKARFRATIKASARPVIRHLLSKKAATNERKASKVLGIIFIVFVILWSPFFIVNILSVTCRLCMTDITAKLMSVILWMGYAASLANPIIYTMFNTAFRRTFIKILTCKLQRRRSKYTDTALHSYTTMMHTERRNTMTVLIKDDSR